MQPDLFSQPPGNNRIIFSTARPGTPRQAPHYYRCNACLSTVATVEPLPVHPKHYSAKQAACACGADVLEYLGQAGRNARLQKTMKLCPCDARCTGAQGPNCDCQCGGVNHGSDLLIEVTRDTGAVPVLKMKSPALAKLQREQFEGAKRETLGRMQATYGGALGQFERNEWIDRETWRSIRSDKENFRHACGLKSQKGRLCALAKIAKLNS